MMFRGGVGDRRDQTKLKILLSKVFFPCCPAGYSSGDPASERNTRTVPDSLGYDDGDDIQSIISLGENSARWATPCPSMPSVPNHLASVPSNRTMLPPLVPLSGAIVNMMAARKAETDENDSGFKRNRCKSKSMNKKVERQEEKLLAVLVKQNKNMREKRQQLKKKLACKKLQVKEDLNKVKCAKKRVQLEQALQVKWSEIDHMSQEEKAMARIERNNAIIRTLEREVEILKEKQTCKRMEQNLVCTKECKGVLSETIKQCKSTIIMHKHSALDKKINNILTEVNFLRDGVSPEVTSSTNTKDITLQSVAQQKSGPITSGALISSFLGHSSRCQAQTEKDLISQEATTSKEVPPQIVKLESGFPTSNTVTTCLASLGDSSTPQVQTEQEIMNLEELVPESCEISEHTCGEEETCQDSLDSKSTYSFTFEEDVDSQDEDATDDQMGKINIHSQPMYSCTRLVSLHKLLPRLLEIIEEETQKDLEDYENETFTCNFKFYPSCIEGDIRDISDTSMHNVMS